MAPRAQPMIIPGKKRPAGTLVPYVVMVKKYQTEKNRNIDAKGRTILSSIMFLMTPPSVAQNKEAKSLLLMILSGNVQKLSTQTYL